MKDNQNERPATKTSDCGYCWVIVAAAFMVHVISDGVLYTLGVFYIEFLDEFQQGKGKTAWITSLIPGTMLMFGPVSGALTTRYGSRVVTIIGAIIAATAFIISFFATSIYYLYCSLGFLTGIGFSCIFLPTIVCVGHYFEERRSFALGLTVSGSGIGTFTFAPIIRILVDEYGWRGALLIEAAIIMNIIVCGAFFKPLNKSNSKIKTSKAETCDLLLEEKSSLPLVADMQLEESVIGTYQMDDNSKSVINMITSDKTKNSLSYKDNRIIEYTNNIGDNPVGNMRKPFTAILNHFDIGLLRDPLFIIFTISNFLTSLGFNAPYVYLPDRSEEGGINKVDSAFLLSIIGIANTVGRIVFGWIADRKCVNRLILYSSALIICGTVNILNPLNNSRAYLMCYSAIYGLFIGVFISLNSVILIDLLGLNRLNKALGLLMLFQGISAFIGSPIFGWLYDGTGSYDISFYVVGALFVSSGVVLYMIPLYRRHKGDQRKEQQIF